MSNKRIAIIGGGAAGMMCAATMVERGFDGKITLFERNGNLGAKVIISGGGRCNVTSGITDIATLKTKYPRGAQFLVPALKAFGPAKIRSWFEAHGTPLKEEVDGRVFPVSDDGHDIVHVFEQLFTRYGVHIALNTTIKDVSRDSSGHFRVQFVDKRGRCATKRYDAVVITTGGNAYARTGSRGDGYAFARGLGHTITPLGPSLNSFLTRDSWTKELSGTSFAQARIIGQRSDGSRIMADGPVLLTHFGISGPATFAYAALIPYAHIDDRHIVKVFVRIRGDEDYWVWEERFVKIFAEKGHMTLVSILKEWMTVRFAHALCAQCDIVPTIKCAEISKPQRDKLTAFLGDGFPVIIIGRRPGDEFVTAGGVSLDEISSKTGMSRRVDGLYFAGEVLDVDGVTGGFNLTASWAMGHIVGRDITKKYGTMKR